MALDILVPAHLANEIIKASGGRDGKVYLAPGEDAPEGVEVVHTRRGARYYIKPGFRPKGEDEPKAQPKADGLKNLRKEDFEITPIGRGGIHAADTMIADLKNGELPDRPGFNRKRVLYKKVEYEIPCEVAAWEVAEVIGPGWAPEVQPADLGRGKGHVMNWIDNFNMAGATAHAPERPGGWNAQKIRDAARMWALDIIIGNSDRHGGNYIEDDADGGHIRPIDNGYAFNNEPGEKSWNGWGEPGVAGRAYGYDVNPEEFYGELAEVGRRLQANPSVIASALERARQQLEAIPGYPGGGRSPREKARNIEKSGLTNAPTVLEFAKHLIGLKDKKAKEIEDRKKAAERAKEFLQPGRLFMHRGDNYRVLDRRADGHVQVKVHGKRDGLVQWLDPARADRWALDYVQNHPDPADWKEQEGGTKLPPELVMGRQYHIDGEKLKFKRNGGNGDLVFDAGGGNERRIKPNELADMEAAGKFRPGTPEAPKPAAPRPDRKMVGDLQAGDEVVVAGERLRFKRQGKDGAYVFARVNGDGEKRLNPWGNQWAVRDAFRNGFEVAQGEAKDPAEFPDKGDNIVMRIPGKAGKNWKVADIRRPDERGLGQNGVYLQPAGKPNGRWQFVGMAQFERMWDEQKPKPKAPKKEPAAAKAPAGGKYRKGQHVEINGNRYEVIEGPRADGFIKIRRPGARTDQGVPGAWFDPRRDDVKVLQEPGRAPRQPGQRQRGGRWKDVVNVRGVGPMEVVGFGKNGQRRVRPIGGGPGRVVEQDDLTTMNPKEPEKAPEKPAAAPRGDRTPGGRLNRPPKKTPELRAGMRLRIPVGGEDKNIELIGNAGFGMWDIEIDGRRDQLPRNVIMRRMRQVAEQGKHPVLGWAKRDKALVKALRASSAIARAYG